MSHLVTYCRKIVPFVHYYRDQTNSFNCREHNILNNEIGLILPRYTDKQEKRGIITLLISGFIGLAYEGISSFLHNRRHKVLHKAVKAMETKVTIQCNKLMHFKDTVVMYGVYNTETLEKLINTVHIIHNNTTPNERLYAGDFSSAFAGYINQRGVQLYAVNILLYLRTLRDKYVKMHEEFIMQLHNYAKAIRILGKLYLPILLITPLRLQELLDKVKIAMQKTNLDYEIIIKRLHP